MTAVSSSRASVSTGAGLPRFPRHWLAAAGLLLLEYLAVSLAFDVEPLTRRAGWLAAVGRLGALGPLGIAVATATLALGGHELRTELRRAFAAAAAPETARTKARLWLLIGVHGAGLAAFVALTGELVRETGEPARGPGLLVIAWAASGLVAATSLVHAVLPLGAFVSLARRLGRVLGIGVAVGLSAWGAGLGTVRFWDPLASVTLPAVAALLRLAGVEVFANLATATLGAGGFAVVIDPTCSGYEGIGLILVLTLAYLGTFRSDLRFPHVLALVPLAVLLVWLANALRIAALIAVGSRWSPEVALGGFHSKAGWLLFCAIALGLVALTRRSAWLSRRAKEGSDARGPTWNPTAAYLMPLLGVVASGMVTGLLSTNLNLLYPVGVVAGAGILWLYRGYYPPAARPSWSWTAFGIGAAVFALWIALEPSADPHQVEAWEREFAELPPAAAGTWLVFRVLGSVALVPVVEELAFRGYLLRRLLSANFSAVAFRQFGWSSFLISSVAFGLLHQRWLAGCLAGMLFAAAQYRRGRLGDAIVAHVVANSLVAFYALGWQRWSLWM